MQKITTYQQNAIDLLPGQFFDSANLKALIEAYVGDTYSVQEIENVLWEVLTERGLRVATGNRLDESGTIVGQPREVTADDDYRNLLFGKIGMNCSEGTAEELISIVGLVSNPEFVEVRDRYPACFQIYAHDVEFIEILYKLQYAGCGGVKVVIQSSADDNPFVFGPDRDGVGTEHGTASAYGAGWGETTESIGGTFTETFERGVPE